MAGNEAHNALLREKYPDAVSVECNGYGGASVRYADANVRMAGKCPGCARDELEYAVTSFMPPRFRTLVPLPALVAEWAAKGIKAQGLYLTGPVGTGKTHTAWSALAAWCLAADIAPRGETTGCWDTRIRPTVIFTRLVDLLDDLRPGDEVRQRVRDCQMADLLAIDDIGAEKPSEWTQERLYSVIDHRYANCLPLIVTSNLPPKGLAAQAGDRTASRLAEMCRVVPMTGTDRRKPAA